MPAKVALIGFDAAEITVVERLIGEGRLPTFASLGERGTTVELANNVDTLPASVWAEISTGRSASSIGWYWNRWQVHSGEDSLRPTRLEDVDLTALWHVASEAGKRVAVVDVPHTSPSPGLNGVQLREWGTHDTAFDVGTDPPELLGELEARHGRYPGFPGDDCEKLETPEELARLLEGLKAGVEAKRRVMHDVLDREHWDLFVGVFSESHCVGHQFWSYFDTASPWYQADAPYGLPDAIPTVYGLLDEALAGLLERLGPETPVFVVFGHGMGHTMGGPQLLPEVLVRLGYGSGAGVASRIRGRLPQPVKDAVRAIVRGRARQRLQVAAGSLPSPLASPATRAVAVPNGRCGAIRINLKGREPNGSVEPGAEYDRLCSDLIDKLERLENVDSGEPAVREVVRTDEALDGERHPNIPDLIVRFATSGNPIQRVRSAEVGTVTVPIEQHAYERSGDHTPNARLWVLGPGAEPGAVLSGPRTVDIAPTLLTMLGVDVPATIHGKPLGVAREGATVVR